MNKTIADFVIIGGGMAGAGVAAMLPEDVSVVLLERESQCGYHSTGRSAAAWVAGYGAEEIRILTRHSKSYLMDPPQTLTDESFLNTRGEMLIACSDAEQQALQKQIDTTEHLHTISSAEASSRVPVLKVDRLRQVAYTSEAYDIDADRLLQAWTASIKKRGTDVLSDWQVTGLKRMVDHWQITNQSGEVVLARTVVNAAGAWADSVAKMASLAPLGLIPHRRSAALLPALSEHDVRAWPLVISADETWYARPMGNTLMVSPADETPVEPHDAYAEDLTIAQGLSRFEDAMNITVERVETTWAGLRTFARDRVPVVGFDTRAHGFFWLAGQGGYGIQTAPAMSRLAAALLMREVSVEFDQSLVERLNPMRLLC